MAWSSLLNSQWVSCNDLQNAVTTGVFILNPGQSIPATNGWVTRTEAETWIDCTVTSGTSNQWPQKSWIVPNTTTTSSTTTSTTSVPIFERNAYISVQTWPCDYFDFPDVLYERGNKLYSDTEATIIASQALIKRTDVEPSVWQWNLGGGETYNNSNKARIAPSTWSDNTTQYTLGSGQNIGSQYLYVEVGKNYRVTATITGLGGSQAGTTCTLRVVDQDGTGTILASSTSTTPIVSQEKIVTFSIGECQTVECSIVVDQDPPAATGSIDFTITYEEVI